VEELGIDAERSKPARSLCVARPVTLGGVDRVSTIEPAVGSSERGSLEPRERGRVAFPDVLQRQECERGVVGDPFRDLKARNDVRLFPAVHRVPTPSKQRAKLRTVREQLRGTSEIGAHREGRRGFVGERRESHATEIGVIRFRCDTRDLPVGRSDARHLVGEAAVQTDDVGVPHGEQPAALRHVTLI